MFPDNTAAFFIQMYNMGTHTCTCTPNESKGVESAYTHSRWAYYVRMYWKHLVTMESIIKPAVRRGVSESERTIRDRPSERWIDMNLLKIQVHREWKTRKI